MLDHASPAEVARQVLRGNALEARQPALETALVGVDVLGVIAADSPLTVAGNKRHLGDAGLGRECLVRLVAVGDEHGILGDDGLEMRADGFRAEVSEDRIGGLAMAIADDQDGIVLVGGKPWFLGFSAAFPGRPADQLARALGRLENERLVRLDDAGHGASLLVLGRRKEAMTPAERGLQMDAGACRCLPETDAVDERAGILKPLLAQPEPCQRRPRQRVEGALACLAHVALKTTGRAPWLEVRRAAMTTRLRRREPRLDQSNDPFARTRRRQRIDERLALNLAEIPQLLDKCRKSWAFMVSPLVICRLSARSLSIQAEQSL